MIAPANSKIHLSTDSNGYQSLSLPSSSSFMRYPVAAFLFFWLCGWLTALISTTRELFASHHSGPNLFLIFWLGGWTVGGCFAIGTLYQMLRPAIPETLTFSMPGLIYDSGRQPYDMMSFNRSSYRNGVSPWKKIFQKRKVITFSPTEMGTLRLRDTDDGNRLTIDKENERIDLGQGLTEVEREWLFAQLNSVYRL